MKYRKLGNTGIEISAVTFGCWAVGGGKEWGHRLPEETYLDAIKCAVDKGINVFDTAMGYGEDGYSEKLLGRALEGIREKVYISTKCSAPGLTKATAEKSLE